MIKTTFAFAAALAFVPAVAQADEIANTEAFTHKGVDYSYTTEVKGDTKIVRGDRDGLDEIPDTLGSTQDDRVRIPRLEADAGDGARVLGGEWLEIERGIFVGGECDHNREHDRQDE